MVRPGFSCDPQIATRPLPGSETLSPPAGGPASGAGHANGPLRPTWRTRTSAVKPRPGFVLIAHARIVSRWEIPASGLLSGFPLRSWMVDCACR